MTTISRQNVTELLIEWQQGNSGALNELTPLVYNELRRIAHRFMKQERHGNTLQTTALVNEAYVRLVGGGNVDWQNRAHFFAVTAQIMRRILIDHARRRQTAIHGGGAEHVELEDAGSMSVQRATELIELDEALSALAAIDPRKGRVVELRYFGGLSIEETADVLEVSIMTVRRDWRVAKAWLYHALRVGQA